MTLVTADRPGPVVPTSLAPEPTHETIDQPFVDLERPTRPETSLPKPDADAAQGIPAPPSVDREELVNQLAQRFRVANTTNGVGALWLGWFLPFGDTRDQPAGPSPATPPAKPEEARRQPAPVIGAGVRTVFFGAAEEEALVPTWPESVPWPPLSPVGPATPPAKPEELCQQLGPVIGAGDPTVFLGAADEEALIPAWPESVWPPHRGCCLRGVTPQACPGR